ncbi:hypothetical protein [Marinitoga aeolica]|uniref:Uncharacterized protein n=1 Tax=Marinitoga aeolica TaxID=2809031 RepID=A0ABY8PRX6_9BACT|nr:hypothetical protein [Marinitoga aeolica]WGS65392.1 hypothetical protein JRV97_02215 [Marinitoga aeolica]
MNIHSLILIISLIIIGIVFNLVMINYLYINAIYRKNVFKKDLEEINKIENSLYNKNYSEEIIYNTNSATLIKITFDDNIEGVIIQEE